MLYNVLCSVGLRLFRVCHFHYTPAQVSKKKKIDFKSIDTLKVFIKQLYIIVNKIITDSVAYDSLGKVFL